MFQFTQRGRYQPEPQQFCNHDAPSTDLTSAQSHIRDRPSSVPTASMHPALM